MSGFTIAEIEPRLFSFNNPFGACPNCDGLGTEQHIDPDLVVPDADADAARGRGRAVGEVDLALLQADAGGARPSTTSSRSTTSWKELPEKAQDAILYGTGDDDDQLHLRRRPALLQDHEAVRGRDPQPRAPLEGDRERLGARGDRALHVSRRPARPAAATA